jgi:rhodanese-related sulfurtransferase
MRPFTFIALVIVAFIAGVYLFRPQECGAACEKKATSIKAAEFYGQISQGGVTIIDVRTPEEFSSGHISEALNADFNDQAKFKRYLDSLDKKSKYLIYCRTGNRSGQALKQMTAMGFTSVADLSGGIESWQSQNLPVSND